MDAVPYLVGVLVVLVMAAIGVAIAGWRAGARVAPPPSPPPPPPEA